MLQNILQFPTKQNFQLLGHSELRHLEALIEHSPGTSVAGKDLKISLRKYDLHPETESVISEN